MTEEFKNDNVTVQVEKEPGCKIKFSINVSPLAAKAAHSKAVKTINKEVSLPGFRKGRAPDALITKHYGSYVDKEWKDVLVQTAFREAMELTKLVPLNEKSIQQPQLKNATLENGAEITIQFESSPIVPTVNPNELEIKDVKPKEVSQDQIDQALEEVQWHHVEWEEVTDRPLEEGDCAELDIENVDNPGQFICKDTLFEVSKDKMGDWMLNIVLGLNTGESAEGMSEKSEGMASDAEFTPTKCKITVKKIKKAQLPELNDELAKKVGADNLDDLKKKAEIRLENQAKEEAKELLRQQCEELLMEKYPFDLPTSLVQSEMKGRLEFSRRQLGQSNQPQEVIAEKLQNISDSVEKEVNRSLSIFFLSRKIAEEQNIEVSKDELVRELMMEMYSSGTPLDSSSDPEEARSRVYLRVLSQKVKDFLVDNATIKE